MLKWTYGCAYLLERVIFVSFHQKFNNGHAEWCDSSIFNFLSNFNAVLVLDAPIYTPISSVRIFLFLHILTNTCHFDNIYSNKCKVIFYFNLVYIYLMISDIASYFMYVLVNCTFSLGKCLLRSFVYFYSDLFIFFCYWISIF